MEKPLTNNDLNVLRNNGIIQSDEIALRIGDLIVAENVLSKERRVIEISGLILESNKRVLKD
jgi:hypothetical protein